MKLFSPTLTLQCAWHPNRTAPKSWMVQRKDMFPNFWQFEWKCLLTVLNSTARWKHIFTHTEVHLWLLKFSLGFMSHLQAMLQVRYIYTAKAYGRLSALCIWKPLLNFGTSATVHSLLTSSLAEGNFFLHAGSSSIFLPDGVEVSGS